MTAPSPSVVRRSRALSVCAKTLAIVVTAAAAAVISFAALTYRTVEQRIIADIGQHAADVMPLAAELLSPAFRTGDTAQIADRLGRLADGRNGPGLAAVALDRQGGALASAGHAEAGTYLTTLAKEALATGRTVPGPDQLSAAAPVLDPVSGQVMGAVAAAWPGAVPLSGLQSALIRPLLGGLLVLCAAAAVAASLLQVMIAQPLKRVGAAIAAIASADYGAAVPGTGRTDEIGSISRALDALRAALEVSAETARAGLYRGAAFSGSAAALMVTDADFRILSVNPALTALMGRHAAAIATRVPDLQPDRIEGRSVNEFHDRHDEMERVASDPAQLPYRTDLEFGPVALHIEMNAILDAAGTPIGLVLEWKDRAAELRNAAVLRSIDRDLARAEFTPEGRLETANPIFCRLFGSDARHLHGTDFRTLIGTPGGPAFERLADGEAVSGRLVIAGVNGSHLVLDGGFSAVTDRHDKPRLYVLLAKDISETDAAIAAAESARRLIETAQGDVVETLRTALASLSRGDLTVSIDHAFDGVHEQLRADFNVATGRLRDAMRAVVENADAIRTGVAEISSASDDLNRRTEQQAATLEQTATALDQLTASVRSAAGTAARADGLVSDARIHAETGGRIVRDTAAAMQRISDSSGKISAITGLIDDIAFQTNLLALNAGVEAARAGDAGRGFAVVASEVRALAQRSSEAARQIAELISASSREVRRGVDLAGQAGTALTGIEQAIAEVAGFVSDVALAAGEQSAGLAEINTAVNQLDQVTQHNAAMFEQTTAAGHSLRAGTQTLADTIARFRTERPQDAAWSALPPAAAGARQPLPLHRFVPPAGAGHPILHGVSAALGPAPRPSAAGWDEF